MRLVEIFPPYLYSMRYGDGDEIDEYHRLLKTWTDVDFVANFFESHSKDMDPSFWGSITDPEEAAERTIDEAYDLEDYLTLLFDNASYGIKPDFDDFFHPLDGEFGYVYFQTPMKAYGLKRPSLLRLYAIKITSNCYVITGGGIKYCRKMQESRELLVELGKVKSVRSFLRERGIEDKDDVDSQL